MVKRVSFLTFLTLSSIFLLYSPLPPTPRLLCWGVLYTVFPMAMLLNASPSSLSLLLTHSSLPHRPPSLSRTSMPYAGPKSRDNGAFVGKVSARKRGSFEPLEETEMVGVDETGKLAESETVLYSFTPLPLLLFAALPGGTDNSNRRLLCC